MACQAKQVFYVTDPSNKKIVVVCNGKRILSTDDIDDSTLDVNEISTFSSGLPNIDVENETDENHGLRVDHGEGIWENLPTV
ncbi:hypothetical protein CASFOL_030702 [Castilleja foliolosa]|uniref:Uncharacterized protein n=1 Tax=Castilleja foliolosa TaxID=1961234 RepID=A0ABD3C6V7_9LAMI